MDEKKPKKVKATAVAIVPHDNSAEALISQAIQKGVDVGTMERLLSMRATIKAEQAREAFNAAMAAFQGSQPSIVKDKIIKDKYGKERYRYAPLDVIVRQVKDNLQENGLSYTTDTVVDEGWVTAVCKVTHTLGHSETSQFKVPIDKDGYMSAPQKFAAALTFAKRYAFCNAFGILTGDEDTDANFDKDEVLDDVVPTVTYDDHENVPATKAPSNTGTLAGNNAKPWQKGTGNPAKSMPKSQDPVLVLKDQIKKLCDSITMVPLESNEYVDYVLCNTGLDLKDQSESNLKAIIERLEALK